VRTDRSYTLDKAVADWMNEGLDGRSASTLSIYRVVLKPVLALIGSRPLNELTAHEVRAALVSLAEGRSTRFVAMAHNALTRAIRHAEANDHVRRNVAALATRPKGQTRRPSKALTPVEEIARLAGHSTSRTTEAVYRKELRPALTGGAELMDAVLGWS
jgi:integrase